MDADDDNDDGENLAEKSNDSSRKEDDCNDGNEKTDERLVIFPFSAPYPAYTGSRKKKLIFFFGRLENDVNCGGNTK